MKTLIITFIFFPFFSFGQIKKKRNVSKDVSIATKVARLENQMANLLVDTAKENRIKGVEAYIKKMDKDYVWVIFDTNWVNVVKVNDSVFITPKIPQ